MGDANVVNLQRAVNRFAASVGFTPIAADGVVGAQTLTTTKRVLTYIAVDMTENEEPFSSQAGYFDSKVTSTTGLAVSAAQLAGFLNQVATTWALPLGGPDGTSIFQAGSGTVIGTKPGLATSLVGGWQRLAAWQKIGAIIFALVIALWGHKQWKRKGGV